MLWIILVLLFLSLLIYLLLLPINIVIDSIDNQYFVSLGSLAKANVAKDDDYLLRIDLRTLFLRFKFYPLKKRAAKKKKKKRETEKKKIKWSQIKSIFRIVRSFEVKQFSLDIDTGHCITNAKLYPVFAFLDFWVGNYRVNFIGRNSIVLHLQNRPYRIIKSFINPKKLYHGITL